MCWPRNSGGGLVWWEAMGSGWDVGEVGGEMWDRRGGVCENRLMSRRMR
jgi:hypothetical protein